MEGVRMHLTMWPARLLVARMKMPLPDCAYAFLEIFLQTKPERFFSLTRTTDEISFIMDEETLALFPEGALEVVEPTTSSPSTLTSNMPLPASYCDEHLRLTPLDQLNKYEEEAMTSTTKTGEETTTTTAGGGASSASSSAETVSVALEEHSSSEEERQQQEEEPKWFLGGEQEEEPDWALGGAASEEELSLTSSSSASSPYSRPEGWPLPSPDERRRFMRSRSSSASSSASSYSEGQSVMQQLSLAAVGREGSAEGEGESLSARAEGSVGGTDMDSPHHRRSPYSPRYQYWRALQLSEGSLDSCVATGVVESLALALANKGISIFYLSTYETDWTLVPEERIHEAIDSLKETFTIMTEGLDQLELSVLRSRRARGRSSGEAPCKSKPPKRLALPNERLHLCTPVEEAKDSIGHLLLKELFWPCSGKTFFSYTAIEDEYSLILEDSVYQNFSPNSLTTPGDDCWRLIKVADGPLGFIETGIVASLVAPISRANVSLFYISTFLTDHVLVDEPNFSKAVSALQQEKDKFIVPNLS
ncbi:GATS protein-like 3 [Balamuthia mandrillaris]